MEIVENGLIPEQVAERERHWSRRHAALRLREVHGYTFREIGECLKVSIDRARRIYLRAVRDINEGKKSPVEVWIGRQDADVHEIIWHLKRRAKRKRTPNSKTQRPVLADRDLHKEIKRLKAIISSLRNELEHSRRTEDKVLNNHADLQRRFEAKTKEFDERYMELVMDHQDLKQYAMQLEEALGIRHKQPRPLSQKGNRTNIDTD